jgi:hypothetical protein
VTPDEPPSTTTDAPDTSGELVVREHEVSVRVPRSSGRPQMVRIVVQNENGSEQTVYEEEHQPGDDVKQTVATSGAKGKCEIRVYLNGRQISRTRV